MSHIWSECFANKLFDIDAKSFFLGSGKTACFLIPLFEKLKARQANTNARALILSPTRELAVQTFKFIKEIGKYMDLQTILVLGGDPINSQFQAMHTCPDVIVATPGRFLHLCVEMDLKLSSIGEFGILSIIFFPLFQLTRHRTVILTILHLFAISFQNTSFSMKQIDFLRWVSVSNSMKHWIDCPSQSRWSCSALPYQKCWSILPRLVSTIPCSFGLVSFTHSIYIQWANCMANSFNSRCGLKDTRQVESKIRAHSSRWTIFRFDIDFEVHRGGRITNSCVCCNTTSRGIGFIRKWSIGIDP